MTNVCRRSYTNIPWTLLMVIVGTLGLSGCAEMKTFLPQGEMPQPVPAELTDTASPTPQAPTVEEVEAAIATTKTLLDDQERQLKELLTLKAQVKQELREFKEGDLTTMRNTVEELQHQVESWEAMVNGNHGAVASRMATLIQEIRQAQDRLVAYGGQVPALADQIDQNHQEHATLFTAFQASLMGFQAAMGELQQGLGDERQRASQEERALSATLMAQHQALQQVGGHTTEIFALQKRLNQLHGYINSVRTSVESETNALRVSLKNGGAGNLQEVVTAFEQRYQDSEQRHAATVAALEQQIQEVSAGLATVAQSISQKEAGTVPTASIHTTTSSPRPKKE